MFKQGSIRKIQVKDFVTYSYVEFFPGPNLNMLIGPNGTGKSTIVAAIILGLGGNPKIVGRGSKVSEYVKHNCDEATINIFLQGESDNDFIKITRIITISDKTAWMINHNRVLARDIVDCVRQYNIQVDNLCQFLPQDRVQEFARLNQQQLLKETQVALCRQDLLDKQERLIECRENHKQLTESIEKDAKKLKEELDANSRLEGKIENFGKKTKFLERIQHIDRKMAWLEYDDSFDRMTEAKADLAQATQIYERHRSAAKPLEREIETAKKSVGDLQSIKSNIARSVRECESSVRTYLDKLEQIKEKVRDVESDRDEKLAMITQREQEINSTAAKIEELKETHRQLINKCGNDDEIQEKTTRIGNEINKFRTHINRMQSQKDELANCRQAKMAELRALEHEITRLENIRQQRLNQLQRVDNDAYEAVLWLRNNKNLFKYEVFEPIMLELDVLDKKNAIYVESVIPFRDRVAFTCVNRDDMNNLIRYLRNEKNLTVNVLYAGDPTQTPFHPLVPIEQLTRYGLYTYLTSLFSAPEPIMRYLCRTYRLHNIPVGTSKTNQFFDSLPDDIRVFFSDSVKYTVSYSKYSRAKSTRQVDIQSDGGLSTCLDVLRLERIKGQRQELRTSCEKFDANIREYDNQIALTNDQISKMGEELRPLRNAKQQAQTIEGRIIAMQRKVKEMRGTSSNGDEIRAQAQSKIKRLMRGIRQLVLDLENSYKSVSSLNLKNSLNGIKIENGRRVCAYLENKNEEALRLVKESERTMTTVKDAYLNIKGKAKTALHKAKSLSKGHTPDQPEFEEFRHVFDALPSEPQVLLEDRQQLSDKIDCLITADADEMHEYEERVRTIAALRERAEQAGMEADRGAERIERLKEEWLGPLRELVAGINANFGDAFARMGCAGEVAVNAGDDAREFAKYGLQVKVTFRGGEPLQELNAAVQSGGERAVATAAFMLALQEMTPVPFRCVDEINQGMDAQNERMILGLLMEKTGEAGTPQYFLVTPKLVQGLTYSGTTAVHIVHNGPFIEADRKWGMSKLCNPGRVQMH